MDTAEAASARGSRSPRVGLAFGLWERNKKNHGAGGKAGQTASAEFESHGWPFLARKISIERKKNMSSRHPAAGSFLNLQDWPV
jgi:hypothetical protein